MAMMDAEFKAS